MTREEFYKKLYSQGSFNKRNNYSYDTFKNDLVGNEGFRKSVYTGLGYNKNVDYDTFEGYIGIERKFKKKEEADAFVQQRQAEKEAWKNRSGLDKSADVDDADAKGRIRTVYDGITGMLFDAAGGLEKAGYRALNQVGLIDDAELNPGLERIDQSVKNVKTFFSNPFSAVSEVADKNNGSFVDTLLAGTDDNGVSYAKSEKKYDKGEAISDEKYGVKLSDFRDDPVKLAKNLPGFIAEQGGQMILGAQTGFTSYFFSTMGQTESDWRKMAKERPELKLEEKPLLGAAYTTSMATIEALMEKLGMEAIVGKGVTKKLSKYVLDKAVKYAIASGEKVTTSVLEKAVTEIGKKITTKTGKAAINAAIGFISEGAEEGATTLGQDAAKLAVNWGLRNGGNDGADLFDQKEMLQTLPYRVAESTVLGGIAGAGFGGGRGFLHNTSDYIAGSYSGELETKEDAAAVKDKIANEITSSTMYDDATKRALLGYNDVMHDSYNSVPKDATPETKKDILSLIAQKKYVLNEIQNAEIERDSLDETLRDDKNAGIETKNAQLEHINASIKAKNRGEDISYSEEGGTYYRSIGDDKQAIPEVEYFVGRHIMDKDKPVGDSAVDSAPEDKSFGDQLSTEEIATRGEEAITSLTGKPTVVIPARDNDVVQKYFSEDEKDAYDKADDAEKKQLVKNKREEILANSKPKKATPVVENATEITTDTTAETSSNVAAETLSEPTVGTTDTSSQSDISNSEARSLDPDKEYTYKNETVKVSKPIRNKAGNIVGAKIVRSNGETDTIVNEEDNDADFIAQFLDRNKTAELVGDVPNQAGDNSKNYVDVSYAKKGQKKKDRYRVTDTNVVTLADGSKVDIDAKDASAIQGLAMQARDRRKKKFDTQQEAIKAKEAAVEKKKEEKSTPDPKTEPVAKKTTETKTEVESAAPKQKRRGKNVTEEKSTVPDLKTVKVKEKGLDEMSKDELVSVRKKLREKLVDVRDAERTGSVPTISSKVVKEDYDGIDNFIKTKFPEEVPKSDTSKGESKPATRKIPTVDIKLDTPVKESVATDEQAADAEDKAILAFKPKRRKRKEIVPAAIGSTIEEKKANATPEQLEDIQDYEDYITHVTSSRPFKPSNVERARIEELRKKYGKFYSRQPIIEEVRSVEEPEIKRTALKPVSEYGTKGDILQDALELSVKDYEGDLPESLSSIVNNPKRMSARKIDASDIEKALKGKGIIITNTLASRILKMYMLKEHEYNKIQKINGSSEKGEGNGKIRGDGKEGKTNDGRGVVERDEKGVGNSRAVEEQSVDVGQDAGNVEPDEASNKQQAKEKKPVADSEVVPVSSESVQDDKRAAAVEDIERRRQEELSKFGTSGKKTSKNYIKVLGTDEFVSRDLMELAYSNDNGNNPEIGGGGQTLDRIIERGGYSKEELLQLLKPEIAKINAKYDAELASLSKTQSNTPNVNVTFKSINEISDLRDRDAVSDEDLSAYRKFLSDKIDEKEAKRDDIPRSDPRRELENQSIRKFDTLLNAIKDEQGRRRINGPKNQIAGDSVVKDVKALEKKGKLGSMEDMIWQQDGNKLEQDYRDAAERYVTTDSVEDGNLFDEIGKKVRAYRQSVRAAYSAGNIPDSEIGNYNKIDVSELKPVGGKEVYHLSVSSDKVEAEGFLTQDEIVKKDGRKGLGGGRGGISLTYDKSYAERLFRIFTEIKDALNGKVDIADEFKSLGTKAQNDIVKSMASAIGGEVKDIREAIENNKTTYEKQSNQFFEGPKTENVKPESFIKHYYNALSLFSDLGDREWIALHTGIEKLKDADIGIFKAKTKENVRAEILPAEREYHVYSGDAITDLERITPKENNGPKNQIATTPLLAPNGKPSNLTTEQHAMVRTPEFKAWFGDWENDPDNSSKVVDDNGEPLVVYHGTSQEFDEFLPEKLGSNTGADSAKQGFFFSDNKNVAQSYTRAHMVDNPNLEGLRFLLDKMGIVQLKSLAKDVFGWDSRHFEDTSKDDIIDDIFTSVERDDGFYADRRKYIEKAQKYFSGIGISFNPYMGGTTISAFARASNPFTFDAEGQTSQDIGLSDMISQAKQDGYDGVIIKDVYDSISFDDKGNDTESSNVVIVFESNQIKSTDNTGSFNPASNNIRNQIGKNDVNLQNETSKGQSKGSGTLEKNTEQVWYNGTNAIGKRSRSESEKAASRQRAKEKISSPETNTSLKAANEYNKSIGLPEVQPHRFKPSDKGVQSEIGTTYEQLQDVTSPEYRETDLEKQIFDSYKSKYPELFEDHDIKSYKDLVEKSYDELTSEVDAQFYALPVQIDFHDGDQNYESSAEMLDDVHNFGHLWVFRGGEDHTLLGSKTADKNGLTANDKFRAVHDYFGHSIAGYQFGKDGEENAWIEHSKMFSPLAQLALSSETRGQNSVVNYSGVNDVALVKMKTAAALNKKGLAENNSEMIADAKLLLDEANEEFQFAEQKSLILPEKYTDAKKYFSKEGVVRNQTESKAPQQSASTTATNAAQEALDSGINEERARIVVDLTNEGKDERSTLKAFSKTWLQAMERSPENSAFREKGLELIKDTPYFEENGKDAVKALEAAIADNAAKLKEFPRPRFTSWLKNFWQKVGQMLKINIDPADLRSMKLQDYLDIASGHLIYSNQIYRDLVSEEVQERENLSNEDASIVDDMPDFGDDMDAKYDYLNTEIPSVFAPSETERPDTQGPATKISEVVGRDKKNSESITISPTDKNNNKLLALVDQLPNNSQKKQVVESLILLAPTLKELGVSVVVHTSQDSFFNSSIKEGNSETITSLSNGFYSPDSNTIHINLQKKGLRANVAVHETVHPIITELLTSNPDTFKGFVDDIMADPELRKLYYDSFARNYYEFGVDIVKEELVTEAASSIIMERILRNLDKADDTLIQRVLNYILNALGSKYGQLATAINTRDGFVAYANSLADAISQGMAVPVSQEVRDNIEDVRNKLSVDAKRHVLSYDRKAEMIQRTDNLTAARTLEEKGVSNEDIRLATGWDNKDGKKTYNPVRTKAKSRLRIDSNISAPQKGLHGNTTTLGDIISDNDIFKKYPQIKDIPVTTQAGQNSGGFLFTKEDGSIGMVLEVGNRPADNANPAIDRLLQKAVQAEMNMIQPILQSDVYSVVGNEYDKDGTIDEVRDYIKERHGLDNEGADAFINYRYAQLAGDQVAVHTDFSQGQYFDDVNDIDMAPIRSEIKYSLDPSQDPAKRNARDFLMASIRKDSIAHPDANWQGITSRMVSSKHITQSDADEIMWAINFAKRGKTLDERKALVMDAEELTQRNKKTSLSNTAIKNEAIQKYIDGVNDAFADQNNYDSDGNIKPLYSNGYIKTTDKELRDNIIQEGSAHPEYVLEDLIEMNRQKKSGEEITVRSIIAMDELKRSIAINDIIYQSTNNPDIRNDIGRKIDALKHTLGMIASAYQENGSYAGRTLGLRSRIMQLEGISYQSVLSRAEKIDKDGDNVGLSQEDKDKLKEAADIIQANEARINLAFEAKKKKNQTKKEKIGDQILKKTNFKSEIDPTKSIDEIKAIYQAMKQGGSSSNVKNAIDPARIPEYLALNTLIDYFHQNKVSGFRKIVEAVKTVDPSITQDDVYDALIYRGDVAIDGQDIVETEERRKETLAHARAIRKLERLLTEIAESGSSDPVSERSNINPVNDVKRLLDAIRKNIFRMVNDPALRETWENNLSALEKSYDLSALTDNNNDTNINRLILNIGNLKRSGMLAWAEKEAHKLDQKLEQIKTRPGIEAMLELESDAVQTIPDKELSRLLQQNKDKSREINGVLDKYRKKTAVAQAGAIWKQLRATIGSSLAMIDLSAVGVQGFAATVSNLYQPRVVGKAFKEMFKAIGNSGYANVMYKNITDDVEYEDMMSHKLNLHNPNGTIHVLEQYGEDDWFDKAYYKAKDSKYWLARNVVSKPLQIRRWLKEKSDATFSTYLNALSFYLYKSYTASRTDKASGVSMASSDEKAIVARGINNATGRPKFDRSGEQFISSATNVLWAPRLYTSQIFNPANIVIDPLKAIYYTSKGNKEKGIAYRHRAKQSMALAVFGGALFYAHYLAAMLKCGHASIGTDHESSEYLKINCDGIVIDVSGNMVQYARMARNLYQTIVEGKDLGETPYTVGTYGVLGKWLQYHLSPHISSSIQIATGKDFRGKRYDETSMAKSRYEAAKNALIPIWTGSTYDFMFNAPEIDASTKAVLSAEGLLGIGVRYTSAKEKEKQEANNVIRKAREKEERKQDKKAEAEAGKQEVIEKYGSIPVELQGEWDTPSGTVDPSEFEPTEKYFRDKKGRYKVFKDLELTGNQKNQYFVVKKRGRRSKKAGLKYKDPVTDKEFSVL